MNITLFGIYFAISLCILSVKIVAYHSCIEGQNLILIIISLELFLLSIGV